MVNDVVWRPENVICMRLVAVVCAVALSPAAFKTINSLNSYFQRVCTHTHKLGVRIYVCVAYEMNAERFQQKNNPPDRPVCASSCSDQH